MVGNISANYFHSSSHNRVNALRNIERNYLHNAALLNSSSPINISLNAEQVAQIKSCDCDAFELLMGELAIWRELVGCRPLGGLELVNPLANLEAYEVTNLIRTIGSSFHIMPLAQREHRVVFSPNQITKSHLALLKGLGFNQCQLLIQSGCSLDSLANFLSSIRDYRFSCVGIQITHWDCVTKLSSDILKIMKKCRPNYIFIGASSKSLKVRMLPVRSVPIIDESDVKECDIICLGPEAVSNINQQRVENAYSAKRYCDALKRNVAPFMPVTN